MVSSQKVGSEPVKQIIIASIYATDDCRHNTQGLNDEISGQRAVFDDEARSIPISKGTTFGSNN